MKLAFRRHFSSQTWAIQDTTDLKFHQQYIPHLRINSKFQRTENIGSVCRAKRCQNWKTDQPVVYKTRFAEDTCRSNLEYTQTWRLLSRFKFPGKLLVCYRLWLPKLIYQNMCLVKLPSLPIPLKFAEHATETRKMLYSIMLFRFTVSSCVKLSSIGDRMKTASAIWSTPGKAITM